MEALCTTHHPMLHDIAEVAAIDGDLGVVGAEGGLANGQSPLIVRAGASQVTKLGQDGTEVAVPGGHVRVVGTVAVVWMSTRRHGCGGATAKAPGRAPGPCCWPPGVARQVACYCCPLGDNSSNSAEVRRPRAKVPRTAIEFVEPNGRSRDLRSDAPNRHRPGHSCAGATSW
jgi:hypothetical protein